MKRSRYTPEQVAFGLYQAEEGTPVAEVCRKMGISEQTFYRWKKRRKGDGCGRGEAAASPTGGETQGEEATPRSPDLLLR